MANIFDIKLARVSYLVRGAIEAQGDVVKSPAMPTGAENSIGEQNLATTVVVNREGAWIHGSDLRDIIRASGIISDG